MDGKVINSIKVNYDGLKIESWRELVPELEMTQWLFKRSRTMVILITILVIMPLVLTVGPVNR